VAALAAAALLACGGRARRLEEANALRLKGAPKGALAGYKVLLAADGFAALKLASEYYPDMLCSDVGMPGMDGLELSRRFRDLPGNRLAPVLLLTAFGTTTDKLSGFQAGAIDYMVKPFEPKELIARVESQLKLRDLALRLSRSEKLASLGTMSAGLAHEIRNPANGLLNALDPLFSMLPAEAVDPESGTGQLLDVVRDCAQQIGRLSKQLLGFKNDGALICTDENVQRLVKRALSMTDAKRGNLEVRARHAYGESVKCAAPLMLQVLVNLIDNAIQAAGPGGWIEVVTRLDGDKVVFDVSDSGAGVPAEIRERIFEPFFTTKDAGQGTGLGLSTSRHIVEQHQGTLRVVEGVRSTFSVALPLNGPALGSVPISGAHQERSKQAVS
jgi:signal transduction histidine kinase